MGATAGSFTLLPGTGELSMSACLPTAAFPDITKDGSQMSPGKHKQRHQSPWNEATASQAVRRSD